MNREAALKTLSDGDPQSRRRAVRALGQWTDSESLGAIVAALHDLSREVQEAASDTLLEVGDSRAVQLLIPLLRSDSPSGRNFARLVLERLGKAEPQLIIQLSRDADPRMRIFCANILSGMCDHDFAPTLHHLLGDTDINVRDAAIVALGRLGAAESVPRLAPFLGSAEAWVRFSAIDALSKIPGTEAARALATAVPAMEADLREVVIDALGQQGSPDAVDLLLELLGRLPDLRAPILRVLLGPLRNALAARRPGPATSSLVSTLAEELGRGSLDEKVAPAAIALLGSLGGGPQVPALLGMLRTARPPVLSAAVAALRALEPGLDPALARQVRDALSALSASRKEFP